MDNGGGDFMASRVQQDGQCCSSAGGQKAKTVVYDTHYNMEHKHRGWAIVLNHEHFQKTEINSRNGTDIDCSNITRCLEKLGFRVKLLQDPTYYEIAKTVHEVSSYDHSDCDCFVLVALTHGEMNVLNAYNCEYDLHDLLDPFMNDICPTLANKPRLFIIQACQGGYVDSGIDMMRYTETDSSHSYNGMHLLTHEDFLVAYSTVPHYFSWRNPTSGSWFIQVLCEELEQNAYNYHILALLTFVSRRIAVDYESYWPGKNSMHQKKQMPCITTTLTRLLCFNRKNLEPTP